MYRRIMKAVLLPSLVAVAVAVVPNSAEAGCKNLPPHMCASWIQGSLLCENIANGVPRKAVDDIGIECEVLGTSSPTGADCTSAPPAPGSDCEVVGNLKCVSPGGGVNDKGEAFVPDAFSASATTACTRWGTCIATADVSPDPKDLCPGPGGGESGSGWTVNFTPNEFWGITYACLYGEDDEGACCASDKRTTKEVDGEQIEVCVKTAEPTRLAQLCYIGADAPRYTCEVFDEE